MAQKLTITEQWIRNRIQLTHDNLDDVRSLSLPGTYHEKISLLGDALSAFGRLKHLDLSRNALYSLEGLENLVMLETLNLYYNNLSTLTELFNLRYCQNLKELDLRLNPVTKNEPDYRLFVVHMLPNLKKLDDRAVRDSERKTASIHFDSQQTPDSVVPSDVRRMAKEAEKLYVPRAEMIKSLTSQPQKPPMGLDDDDYRVLDFINKENDLGPPNSLIGGGGNSGSSNQFQNPDIRSSQDVLQKEREEEPGAFASSKPLHGLKEQGLIPSSSSDGLSQRPALSQKVPHKVRVQFADDKEEEKATTHDPNLRFTDENQAYTAYSSKGHFTPHPVTDQDKEAVSLPNQQWQTEEAGSHDPPNSKSLGAFPYKREEGTETRSREQPAGRAWGTYPFKKSSSEGTAQKGVQQVRETSEHDKFLNKFLTLVDRYWNGNNSLHRNERFLGQAKSMLSIYEGSLQPSSVGIQKVEKLQEELAQFAQENVSLRSQLNAATAQLNQQHSSSAGWEKEVQAALGKAHKEVEVVRSKLQQTTEENQTLKRQLSMAQMKPLDKADSKRELTDRENEELRQEVERLKLQIKHHDQLQELAGMLQESHKSLVSTNDHLLVELEENKQRHALEVKQLRWSYNELKQTVQWMPTSHVGGDTTGRGGGGDGKEKQRTLGSMT